MAQLRYFYSTVGTDVHGPVTIEELGELFHNGVIGPGSQLCREGGNEWEPLNPANFQEAPKSATPQRSRPRPYEPPPYVPSKTSLEKLKEVPGERWEQRESSAPEVLKWIAVIVGLVAGIILMMLQATNAAVPQSIPYHIGGVIVAFLFLWGVPSLLSLLFRGFVRYLLRLIGVLILSVLSIVGTLNRPPQQLLVKAAELREKMKEEANKEIAEKGVYTGKPGQAEKDLQTLKSEATGNGPAARAARDMFSVTDQFLATIKLSNEAEKLCRFDAVSIESTEDIAHRLEMMGRLRTAQEEVINYLQHFDDHCRDALAKDNFQPDFVDGVLAGAHKSGHVEQLITLWQTRMKLTEDYIAQLDYLSRSYGSWNVKEGRIVFSDTDSLNTYNAKLQALQEDVKVIGEEQKAIVQ